MLFDVAGRSVESVRYSAFGNATVAGEELSPWGFSGKRSDPTGLIYFGQRYYAPELGRWLSPDPWGFIDSSNLYHFCHNNPLSFIDWLGLSSERGGGGIGDLDRRWGDHRQGNQAHSHGSRGVVEAAIVAAAAAVADSGKEIGRAWKKSWRWLLGKKPHNLHLPERSWMTTLQGGMQTLCGMTEVWIRGVLCTTGIGVPLGLIIAAHGFDQAFAGVQTIWSGEHTKTLTCQGLEGLGVAPEWAEATDTALAVMFTMGGGAAIAAETRTAVEMSRQAARAMQGFGSAETLIPINGTGGFVKNPLVDVERAYQKLLDSGATLDRGGFSRAGRGLQKHGCRPGSVFPSTKGTPKMINQQAQRILDQILNSPNRVIRSNRFGGVDVFDATTGRGVRYDANGSMMGFLEP